jgi:hypothetical protein
VSEDFSRCSQLYEAVKKEIRLASKRAFRKKLGLSEDIKTDCELFSETCTLVSQDNFFLRLLDLDLVEGTFSFFAFDLVDREADLLLAGRFNKNNTAIAINNVATVPSIYTTLSSGCSFMNRVADTSRGGPSWSTR